MRDGQPFCACVCACEMGIVSKSQDVVMVVAVEYVVHGLDGLYQEQTQMNAAPSSCFRTYDGLKMAAVSAQMTVE